MTTVPLQRSQCYDDDFAGLLLSDAPSSAARHMSAASSSHDSRYGVSDILLHMPHSASGSTDSLTALAGSGKHVYYDPLLRGDSNV